MPTQDTFSTQTFDETTFVPHANGQASRVVPRAGIGEAARRHWPIVLASVIICVGVAFAIGALRKPNYTATARVNVGRIDLTQPSALDGYVTATQGLATTYSRAVSANAVVAPVAKQLGTSPQEVASEVSATPVPQSPVIQLSATSHNGLTAIKLANAVTASLTSYVKSVNSPDQSLQDLIAQYRRASADYNASAANLASARSAFSHDPSAGNRTALDRAVADADVAKLTRDSLRNRYQTATQNGSVDTGLTLLNPASGASSDRISKLEILLFAGLVAGLAVGLGIAVFRANRILRRVVA